MGRGQLKDLSEYWSGNNFGSHAPILYKILQLVKGPSFELGCGLFSTPIFCDILKGYIFLSFERNELWYKKILNANHHSDPKHEIIKVKEWDEIFTNNSPIIKNYWSIIFVDHAGRRRVGDATKLKNKCDFMLLHDTDADGHGGAYGWKNLWKHFKYYKHFHHKSPIYNPGVTLASNSINVDKWWKMNFGK